MKLPKLSVLIALSIVMLSKQCLANDEKQVEVLTRLAESYVHAQFNFDQALLKSITSPQFVEISPKGEIDERNRVLAFYSEDKRVSSPPFNIVDVRVRKDGSSAFISQVIIIEVGNRKVEMTQGLSAIKKEQTWLLTSSQSTPKK